MVSDLNGDSFARFEQLQIVIFEIERQVGRRNPHVAIKKAPFARFRRVFRGLCFCVGQNRLRRRASLPNSFYFSAVFRSNYSPNAFKTSSACSETLTFSKILTIFPSSSIKKVLRKTPMYFLPYMLFSP